MAITLTENQNQILGAAIIEILQGELSDETIAAVDTLRREDIPEPLNNLVGFMHGMSTYPPLRKSIITNLIDEIRIAAIQVLEERYSHPNAVGGAWIVMYENFKDLLEGSEPNDAVQGVDKDLLPPIEQAPAWVRPLIERAMASPKEGNELSLELLDVLEEIIHKRRAQLAK